MTKFNVLRARILFVQTPASFRSDKLSDAIDFFKAVERDNVTLVWETRGPDWDKPETRVALGKALKKVDVPHVVDPLKNLPDCSSSPYDLKARAQRFMFFSTT